MQKNFSTMTVGDIVSLAQEVVQTVSETDNAAAKTDVTFLNLKTETEAIAKALLRDRDNEKTRLRQEKAKTVIDYYGIMRTLVINEQHSPIEEVAGNAKNLLTLFNQVPTNIRYMKPNVRATYFRTLRDKLNEEPHATEITKANLKPWLEKFEQHLAEYSKLTLEKRDTLDHAKTVATATSLKPAIRSAIKHYFNFIKGRATTTNLEEWMAIDRKLESLYREAVRRHAKAADLPQEPTESTTETVQKVTA